MGASNANAEAQPFLDQPRGKGLSNVFSGWRFSLVTGAVASSAVLLINLSLTIWSTTRPAGTEEQSGRRILFEGSCSKSRTINILVHLLINLFSSVLLAASSYGMQCLSAPTRAEVDKAHQKEAWMDIGVLSVRNLWRLPWTRSILWALLALSSVPLHLLYNSVIFSSLSTVDYTIHSIHKNFTSGNKVFQTAVIEKWDNYSTSACLDAYATSFQTSRKDVLLVCNETEPNLLYEGIFRRYNSTQFDPNLPPLCRPSAFDWICDKTSCEQPCRSQLDDIKAAADKWELDGCTVQYCLSLPVRQLCRINFNLFVAIAVVGANMAKALILVYVALQSGSLLPKYVPDICPRDQDSGAKGLHWSSFLIIEEKVLVGSSKPSTMDNELYCLASSVAVYFLTWGIEELVGDKHIKSLWNLGFGAVSDSAIITGVNRGSKYNNSYIISNVLLANAPQLCFFILYFQYNGLFTCMLSANEWSYFGAGRKALRVSSSPVGEQRSRYFLQIPYRFGIPLLLLSILMHWMSSQSIFVIAVERLNESTMALEWYFVSCGYSPAAIICAIAISLLMAIGIVVVGCRRLPTVIPVVGSCSLAIAAACHHPNGVPQPDAPLLPLQWGVMEGNSATAGSGYRHCGLSAHPVKEPRAGVEYI
ncbi:hypothetical protein NM208_g9563 [Fusarium decemcellulare]|uniref:Uncharacterized protein n=1 Tax=Fusarium decemcellulare TaxID=57161 RepID=A0ACC1S193_9HYPO|nr:hypothetical protein NM208_g9563 [Fusarium decemcellulare]